MGCAISLWDVTPAALAGDDCSAMAEIDQDIEYSGSIFDAAASPFFRDSLDDRLKLTGDWFGAREQGADRGITLDANLTQFFQGVASGGQDQTSAYGGKLDYYLNIDGDKSGLCDGLLVSIHAETRYGEDINIATGMLTFANFNMAFPKEGEDATGITKFLVSQSLSEKCVVFAGKINTLDDFELNFTGRNGIDRFMNSGIVANIINARTVPYSTYGAGFAVTGDQTPGFSFVVRDPNNHATTLDLDQLFADGVLLSSTVKTPVAPFGLPGNQNVGVNWNSRTFTSVDPASFVIVPGQGIVAGEVSGSWAVWYNFDQYLWVSETDPSIGWGVFGMTGISDGDPNPIGWNTTLGLGGSSLIPGRQQDTFGLGYFLVGLSSNFKALLSGPLAPPGLAQRDEHGMEFFYNASLNRYCHLTGDLQVVEPSTMSLDTTVIVGMRLKIEL
ncbi:carbohydrate porin [Planctomicrobium piriforme]|nr:carbohydrate porin [Planctomicrobium piriforme]